MQDFLFFTSLVLKVKFLSRFLSKMKSLARVYGAPSQEITNFKTKDGKVTYLLIKCLMQAYVKEFSYMLFRDSV